MKRCPQCNRVETDEALKFCRVDGTTLINDSSSIGEAGTAKLGSVPLSEEIETNILPHTTSGTINRGTGPTTALPLPAAASTGRLTKSARSRNIVIAIATLVILASGIAVFRSFYLSRKNNPTIQSIAVMPFVNEGGNTDLE